MSDAEEFQGITTEGVVSDAEGQQMARDIASATPKFEHVENEWFKADYGVHDNNIVIQFYLPARAPAALSGGDVVTQQRWSKYWMEIFPEILSPVAKGYFKADVPRIVAAYTEEMTSWWFRAKGFGTVLDPESLARGFIDKLEAALISAESN